MAEFPPSWPRVLTKLRDQNFYNQIYEILKYKLKHTLISFSFYVKTLRQYGRIFEQSQESEYTNPRPKGSTEPVRI